MDRIKKGSLWVGDGCPVWAAIMTSHQAKIVKTSQPAMTWLADIWFGQWPQSPANNTWWSLYLSTACMFWNVVGVPYGSALMGGVGRQDILQRINKYSSLKSTECFGSGPILKYPAFGEVTLLSSSFCEGIHVIWSLLGEKSTWGARRCIIHIHQLNPSTVLMTEWLLMFERISIIRCKLYIYRIQRYCGHQDLEEQSEIGTSWCHLYPANRWR